ncbi:ABC transporter G family member 6-like protein, partial [Leptotrombidium deliense]
KAWRKKYSINTMMPLNEVTNNILMNNGLTNFEKDEKEELMSVAHNVRITLSWKNLSYNVNKLNCIPNLKQRKGWATLDEKIILHPQSGQLSNGCLMAVIGKSGSGKSTLIESLTGRRSE